MSCIRIECEICNKLINAHTIKSHMKTCGQESCRYCDKNFCTPYYRKIHELSHNKNYVRQCLTCPDCNANLSTVSSLNNHKKKCHELLQKKKKLKTVGMQPDAKVDNKRHTLVPADLVAEVVHLPDEDIAAVETITSEIERRSESPVQEFYEKRQKVIIEVVPQFTYVKPKTKSSKK